MSKRKIIINHVLENYNTIPEQLFKSESTCCVFRHAHSKKWYGIIMNIPESKVGLDTGEYIDVLNVKCDPDTVSVLSFQKGFAPAYHMNKKHWLTILLDGSVTEEQIYNLLDISYELTRKR